MLGTYGRRAIDLAVLFLALYAFAFVPLGKKTGLDHLRAILRTAPARDAGAEILRAADRLRHRLLDGDDGANGSRDGDSDRSSDHGAPVVPRLPRKARIESNAKAAPLEAPDASVVP